jgi:hypothetical protein
VLRSMAFSKRSAVNKSLDLDHGQIGPIPKQATAIFKLATCDRCHFVRQGCPSLNILQSGNGLRIWELWNRFLTGLSVPLRSAGL